MRIGTVLIVHTEDLMKQYRMNNLKNVFINMLKYLPDKKAEEMDVVVFHGHDGQKILKSRG